MISADTKGLLNFKKKVALFGKDGNITDKICAGVVQEGTNIASSLYSGHKDIEVSGNVNLNKGQVVSKGKSVAYVEFGTGSVGETSNYPKEKLPTQTIEFESPKNSKGGIPKHQTTNGWVYNYENDDTKVKENGVIVGWYYGHTFTKGQPAGMQMYTTYTMLKRESPMIARKVLKEEKKNV